MYNSSPSRSGCELHTVSKPWRDFFPARGKPTCPDCTNGHNATAASCTSRSVAATVTSIDPIPTRYRQPP